MARRTLHLPRYRLVDVADHFGVTIRDAHTATGDVEAVSAFLPRLLQTAPPLRYPLPVPRMPPLAPSHIACPRQAARPMSGSRSATDTGTMARQATARAQYTCGVCGLQGHNRRTCPGRSAA
jgi:hypothetical protein